MIKGAVWEDGSIMDELDKKLLNELQAGLALTEYPFGEIGNRLGIGSQEVISRIKKLKNKGYIRRLGGVFDSSKFGFTSTLIAAKVPEDSFYKIVKVINSYPGVTHNYRRNYKLNLWFTLTTATGESKRQILNEIRKKTGIELYQLTKEKKFKLKVFLDMEDKKCEN
mgnify:CR=1 FL=1